MSRNKARASSIARRVVCCCAGAVGAALVLGGVAGAGEHDAAVPAVAGLRVHIDPQTGRLSDTPSADEPSVRSPESSEEAPGLTIDSQEFSDSGLLEEPSPGGGVKVNLNGRFRSHATISKSPAGRINRECLSPIPASPSGLR